MSSRTLGSLVFVEPFVGNSVKILGIRLDQGFHHESFSEQVVQVLIRCKQEDTEHIQLSVFEQNLHVCVHGGGGGGLGDGVSVD